MSIRRAGRRTRPPWIIWWAIGVHTAWGIGLVLDPAVAKAAILVGFHHLVLHTGVPPAAVGIALIGAALLAAVGLLWQRLSNRAQLLCLMPQYGLLISALLSDAHAVAIGRADGEVDRLLLLVALFPIMLAAVLHSAAIVERHMRWTVQRPWP